MYVTGNEGSTRLASCCVLNIKKQINQRWDLYARTKWNISKFAPLCYIISVFNNGRTTPTLN